MWCARGPTLHECTPAAGEVAADSAIAAATTATRHGGWMVVVGIARDNSRNHPAIMLQTG